MTARTQSYAGATAVPTRRRRRLLSLPIVVAIATIALLAASSASQASTSDGDPYDTSPVIDTNPDPRVVETTIVADERKVDVGLGGNVEAKAQAFNGSIPGPTFRLKVGDTVIVHYENR